MWIVLPSGKKRPYELTGSPVSHTDGAENLCLPGMETQLVGVATASGTFAITVNRTNTVNSASTFSSVSDTVLSRRQTTRQTVNIGACRTHNRATKMELSA